MLKNGKMLSYTVALLSL